MRIDAYGSLAAVLGAFWMGCSPSGPVEIRLTARVPDDSTSVRWSPAGSRLDLVADSLGAHTALVLGPAGTLPISLRLERSAGSATYDRLFVDFDRNGVFDDGEPLTTTPDTVRGKIWSNFDAVVDVPVQGGDAAANPYSISFWYVFDPIEPATEEVLRFSRRGWMEGDAVIDGVPARILIAESEMDGVFDTKDSWSIAEADSARNVYGWQGSRGIDRHNWLGQKAYRIVSIDPSGRTLRLESGDPGITRAEEAAAEDKLAVDRNAARSGRSVVFEADFEAAETRARVEGKPLFVDFKTVWCGPCFTMDEWVFTADAVVDASTDVVATRVDGDDRRDLAKRFRVEAYPTLLMLAPDGTERGRFVGYLGVDSTALFMRAPFVGRE